MGLKKRQLQRYLNQFPDLTAKDIREYYSAFQLFLHDGVEDKEVLKSTDSPSHKGEAQPEEEEDEDAITLAKLGSIMRALFQNPTETELLEMVREVDQDGNGEIDFEEFMALMSSKNKQLDSKDEMKEAFSIFDRDGDGAICKEELKRVFNHIGQMLTEEECETMIREIDTTGTGKIQQEDFSKLMMMSSKDLQRLHEKKNHMRGVMLQYYQF